VARQVWHRKSTLHVRNFPTANGQFAARRCLLAAIFGEKMNADFDAATPAAEYLAAVRRAPRKFSPQD
jgi:hypothetical protein